MKRARKWVNTPTNRPIRCQAPTTNQRSRNWHLQVVVDSGHMETCSVCRSLAAKWRQTDNEEAGKHRRVTWDNTAASSLQRMTHRLSRRVQQNLSGDLGIFKTLYSQQGKTWHSWVTLYRLWQSCIVTLFKLSRSSSVRKHLGVQNVFRYIAYYNKLCLNNSWFNPAAS